MIEFHAIEWDAPDEPRGNVWHIGEHGLTSDDVEAVLNGRNGANDFSRSTAPHVIGSYKNN